jgi:hypothetical protein
MYNETEENIYMDRKVILFCALLALPLLSPAPIRAWELAGNSLQPAGLPSQSIRMPDLLQTDFDGDGLKEMLVLSDGQARILTGTHLRWNSPPEWDVRQARLGDLNHDGLIEAVLLVWRPFKPWSVDRWLPSAGRINHFQNNKGESCHIILIGWRKNMFRERWAGSALAEPVNTFALADMNRDGMDELITLDSTYATFPSTPANTLKVWEWNGFGFSLVSSVEGLFSDLQVVQTSDKRVILLTP